MRARVCVPSARLLEVMVSLGIVEAAVLCLEPALPDTLLTAACSLLANFACNSTCAFHAARHRSPFPAPHPTPHALTNAWAYNRCNGQRPPTATCFATA